MTRVHRPLLALPVLALLFSAACGDRRYSEATGGAADDAAPVVFVGHDLKEVKSAFPEDGRDVLEQADAVTFYTLNPHRIVDGALSPEKERFRNYGILGQVVLTEAAERRRLVEAVYEGLRGEDAGPASCFFPRHGLRFERAGRRIDLLICFECTWVYIYEGDAEHEKRMLFGAGVQPVFDSIIKRADLPVDGG